MATMTYREQLLHPNWQKKRLQIMQRDEFACRLCGDPDSTLHVHHKQYAKGRLAWEYPDDELVTLCEVCHDTMHAQAQVLRDVVAKLDVDGQACLSAGVSVLAGWAHANGLDFEHLYREDPHNFLCGEVGGKLDLHFSAPDLIDLLDVLTETPKWVVRDAMKTFIKTCLDRLHEPPPCPAVTELKPEL